MQGILTKKHILLRPFFVVRHFGFAVYFKTLCAPKHRTFLDIVAECMRKEEEDKRNHEIASIMRALDTLKSYDLKELLRTTESPLYFRRLALIFDAAQIQKQRIVQLLPASHLYQQQKQILVHMKTMGICLESKEIAQVEARMKRALAPYEERLVAAEEGAEQLIESIKKIIQALTPASRQEFKAYLSPVWHEYV